MSKILIVIEGPDGAGKTFIAKALRDRLASHTKTLLTRAPGGGSIAESLRPMLKQGLAQTLLQELTLLQASWVGCLEQQVEAGDESVVIFDRVPYASSAFYQGLFYRDLPAVSLFWSNLSAFMRAYGTNKMLNLFESAKVIRILVAASDRVLATRTDFRGVDHFEKRMLSIVDACQALTLAMGEPDSPGNSISSAYHFVTRDAVFFPGEKQAYDYILPTSQDGAFSKLAADGGFLDLLAQEILQKVSASTGVEV